jgi:probable HAF family extracellular repeat protein
VIERMKQILIGFLVFGACGCLAVPNYIPVILSPPAPYDYVNPIRINNAGNVIALAFDRVVGAGPWFFWSKSSGYVPVIGPNGSAATSLSGINDKNQVVGSAEEGGFLWTPGGGAIALPVPIGFDTVVPAAINQSGTVVGSVKSGDRSASFMWTSEGGMQVLGAGRQSAAVAVNNLGQILANAEKKFDRTVAILARDDNSLTKLFPLSRGGQTIGVDLNDAGTVAVNCRTPSEFPCVWTKAGGLKLITGEVGFTTAIDNSGQVIGYSNGLNSLYEGFIWSPTEGAFNLNNLLIPGSPSFDYLFPSDISDNSGIVAATGVVSWTNIGVILYPQPSAAAQ